MQSGFAPEFDFVELIPHFCYRYLQLILVSIIQCSQKVVEYSQKVVECEDEIILMKVI